MRSNVLRVSAALVAAGALAGCGPYLRWKARPPAPMVVGRMDVIVTDHREPKKGGADPRHIGNERNGWGIPFPVRLATPVDASAAIHDVFAQAALTAGVGVTPPGDPSATSRLQIDIQNMWCDGYPPVYKASLVAAVTLTGPDNSIRMPAVPVAVEDGGWGCQMAYEHALTKAYDAAAGMMSAPGFKAAAAATAAPPPPPPPAAPAPAPAQ